MPADTVQDELLREVLRRYAGSTHPRLREITEAAIRHLHGFVAEVGLTHDEWMAGIAFLTETGQISDDVRQEFILLSDTLGVSTLVEHLTYDADVGSTENTVLGPFYVPGSPRRDAGASMLVDDDPGEPVVIRGTVTGSGGAPLFGATLDVWQNATSGFYACQQPGVQSSDNLRGIYETDAAGNFEIRTVRPAAYPIPDDGPAGWLLKVHGRRWMRPAHVHFMVSAPGYKTLITHLFDRRSPHLDDDAVFGVRDSLVRDFAPDAAGELAARFDIVLTARQ
jgi:catechol 1,2-dioxygenase